MLEALCELESLCCRIATQRMSAMQRRQLELLHEEAEAAADKRDADAYLALNSRFHQLICQGTQNATLVAAGKPARAACAVPGGAIGVERRFEVSHREHQKIVEAVLAGQPEQAYLAMRSHTTRLTSECHGTDPGPARGQGCIARGPGLRRGAFAPRPPAAGAGFNPSCAAPPRCR